MIKATVKGDTDKMLAKRFLDMLIQKEDVALNIYRTPFYWMRPSYSMLIDESSDVLEFLFCWFVISIIFISTSLYLDLNSIWIIGGPILLFILLILLITWIKMSERRQFMEKLDKMLFMTPDQYNEYVIKHPEETESEWQEATDLIKKMKVLSDCESVLSVQPNDYHTIVKYVTDDKTVKDMMIYYNAEIVENWK